MRGTALLGGLVIAGIVIAGCELTEATIVDFEDIVIAEVYVNIEDAPLENSLRAFLHGTASGSTLGSAQFDDATITVTNGAGTSATLGVRQLAECATLVPQGSTGSCFAVDAAVANAYQPGETLELEIVLADGRRLGGATTIPEGFELDGVPATCRLDPDTRLPLVWNPSDGAWAYLAEASIVGLPTALQGEGIEAPDTLNLVGLSISAADTTISFPDEFGVFDRFDLDRDLAVRLQGGLPAGASGDVAIVAADANFTNWARGGNFNPSGAVRVTSLVGDGAGVFGSAVIRRFTAVSSTATGLPSCLGA